MERRNISKDDVLRLEVSNYGGAETIRHHQRLMNQAVLSLKTALADGNTMLVAQNAGLVIEYNSQLSSLIMDTANSSALENVVR